MKDNKVISLIVVVVIYAIATILGIAIYNILNFSFWLNLLIADVASTTCVFLFSLLLKNASCYDPYWSIAPIVMVLYASIKEGLNGPRILAVVACCIWGIRLTYNWAYTFNGLNSQDWRYDMLKEKAGKLYPIINYLGIHMFPTLVVYMCMLPVIFMFKNEVQMNPLVVVFFILAILCPILQFVADTQMHSFKKQKTNTFIRIGVWKYSRHPNYLGEIMMWWNMAFLAISSLGGYWFLVIGAIINTLMFLFISIPMAENHQRERKPGFDEYKKETRMLIPLKKFR